MSDDRRRQPVLYLVIPCYNEEAVLRTTAGEQAGKLHKLMAAQKIAKGSGILYVDDGSRDRSWEIIEELSGQDELFHGIALSRNRGQQNALFAGLMEVKDRCDAAVTIDCDGQDDIEAIDEMLAEYAKGAEIVYGVRSDRSTDSAGKRIRAHAFYQCMRMLGADSVIEHGDFRLLGDTVLQELSRYPEKNLYLRGLIPLIGFRSTCVAYQRKKRTAGKTHYSLGRELALALDGITGFTIRPIRMITGLGLILLLCGLLAFAVFFIRSCQGQIRLGQVSAPLLVLVIGGIQLICTGVIGEYIGKIYLEVKNRPRYVVEKHTKEPDEAVREKHGGE